MPRTFVFLALVLCLVFSIAAVAETAASAQPTADEIAARNVAARGGLASWRAVRTMTMAGRTDAGKGVELPFRLELKRPHKMRLELEFQGQTAVQVYDGVSGWKLRPFLQKNKAEPFSPEELQAASTQADLDGLLFDYAAKGYKLELLGREPVEGREAYKLKLTGKGQAVRHIWVDSGTLLEVKTDAVRRVRGTERRIESYYRDYKPVNGLLIPHVLETAVQGSQKKHKLTIETVVVNPPLDDSRFAKP
jgi:outer membrane lipoprotein-sorting protein